MFLCAPSCDAARHSHALPRHLAAAQLEPVLSQVGAQAGADHHAAASAAPAPPATTVVHHYKPPSRRRAQQHPSGPRPAAAPEPHHPVAPPPDAAHDASSAAPAVCVTAAPPLGQLSPSAAEQQDGTAGAVHAPAAKEEQLEEEDMVYDVYLPVDDVPSARGAQGGAAAAAEADAEPATGGAALPPPDSMLDEGVPGQAGEDWLPDMDGVPVIEVGKRSPSAGLEMLAASARWLHNARRVRGGCGVVVWQVPDSDDELWGLEQGDAWAGARLGGGQQHWGVREDGEEDSNTESFYANTYPEDESDEEEDGWAQDAWHDDAFAVRLVLAAVRCGQVGRPGQTRGRRGLAASASGGWCVGCAAGRAGAAVQGRVGRRRRGGGRGGV